MVHRNFGLVKSSVIIVTKTLCDIHERHPSHAQLDTVIS